MFSRVWAAGFTFAYALIHKASPGLLGTQVRKKQLTTKHTQMWDFRKLILFLEPNQSTSSVCEKMQLVLRITGVYFVTKTPKVIKKSLAAKSKDSALNIYMCF